MRGKTDVYLFAYHSEKRDNFKNCSGQFEVVERAIKEEPWPYDNGDDPSFYVAKHDGRLTWGVCRQDSRNPLSAPAAVNGARQEGAIAVFFSFSTLDDEQVRYRLCAVATVEEKLDHRAAFRDARLKDHPYINTMIRPRDGKWHFDETNRPKEHVHGDWLWRMCDLRGLTQPVFKAKYAQFYKDQYFTDDDVAARRVRFARNYVLFSARADETFIAPKPPKIAVARKCKSENWTNEELRKLILGTAEAYGGRGCLRVTNPTNCNVHRHIHFRMDTEKAIAWRAEVIRALGNSAPVSEPPAGSPQGGTSGSSRKRRAAGCGR